MTKVARLNNFAAQQDRLPYRVELWTHDDGNAERVLALALNAALARAIFRAAQKEYPDRRILLRRGRRTVADSAHD